MATRPTPVPRELMIRREARLYSNRRAKAESQMGMKAGTVETHETSFEPSDGCPLLPGQNPEFSLGPKGPA